MEKILKYIDENYADIIGKDQIENLTSSSHRNSQRLFKRFFNETISNYQKRLKLENAYKKLVYTSEAIKNIAYDVGYENVTSFNKAFLKHFNRTPSEARGGKGELFQYFIQLNESYADDIYFEVIYLPLKKVFYKLIVTDNYNNESINQLWDDINSGINTYKVNQYGLILDQPLISGALKCRYEACIDRIETPSSYFEKEIFGQKYLKFIHSNEFDTIEETYGQIFYSWITNLDYEIDNSPIIEHYIKDDKVQNRYGYRTEILIPII